MEPSPEDIAGLLDSGNPLDWAMENLEFVGSGEHAWVFAHPRDADLVVRVSDYPDGWFAWADFLSGASPAVLAHAPEIFGVAAVDGHWVAVARRLDEIEGGSAEARQAETAAAVIFGSADAGLGELGTAQPGIAAFAALLPTRFRDLRASNWMLRGGTLVLNDPAGTMTFEEERRAAARWARQPRTPSP